MLKSFSWALTLCLVMADEAPFWKSKSRIYERIKEREVIVSVSSKKLGESSPRYAFHASGGAWVSTPCDFAFKVAKDYGRMAQASEYIKHASYDADKKVLSLRIEAYSRKADLEVEVKASSSGEDRALDFRVLKGVMPGFASHLTLNVVGPQKCEVGFVGDYRYDDFPLPRLFLDFGLEVIFQRMAFRLRRYVEDEYKSQRIPNESTGKTPL